jgi:hypothetical protein
MKAALKEAYTNAGKDTPAGAWRIARIAELPGLIEQAGSGIARTVPA